MTPPCAKKNRDQQKWEPQNDGAVMLRNVATGRYLDDNGAGEVYTSWCNTDNNYLKWAADERGNVISLVS
ncbi:hypothetical protein DMH15_10715 [Streptomyces sp. WAC 06725]|nr:hypothetical protein DMH15_10715 [Streptomyces sp. WAC 06725]